MNVDTLAVAFVRFSELVETKMATGKAAKQVASELMAFDAYCEKSRIIPIKVTTKHLAACKYK